MYTHNGRVIQADKAWTSDDGYQHQKNWASRWGVADLETWSVIYSEDPATLKWDNRFYWGYLADNVTLNPKALEDVLKVDSDGAAVIDPKTGEQGVTVGLKNKYIAQKKAEANALLNETDWYVVRAAEGGSAVPSAITTKRAAIRTACSGIETKLTNAADLDALIALFASSLDGDGNVVKADMDCYS